MLARLVGAFEENEGKRPRDGHAGHVALCLARLARALLPPDDAPLPEAARPQLDRFALFVDCKLRPVLHRRDTPLVSIPPRGLRAPRTGLSLPPLSTFRVATTRRRTFTR